MKRLLLGMVLFFVGAVVFLALKKNFEQRALKDQVAGVLLSYNPEPVNLSPNGEEILLKTRHLDDFELILKNLNTGILQTIDRGPFTQLYLTWHPSNEFLIAQVFDPSAFAYRIYEIRKKGARRDTGLPLSNSASAPLRWSPDGKFLAYRVEGSLSRLIVVDYFSKPPKTVLEWADCDAKSDYHWRNENTLTVRLASEPFNLVNLSIKNKSTEKLAVVQKGGNIEEFNWNSKGTELVLAARQPAEDVASLVLYNPSEKKSKLLFTKQWEIRKPEYYHGKEGQEFVLFHENKEAVWKIGKIDLQTKKVEIFPCENAHCEFLLAKDFSFYYLKKNLAQEVEISRFYNGKESIVYDRKPPISGTSPETPKLSVPAFLWKTETPPNRRFGVIEVHGGPNLQVRPTWAPYRDLITHAGADLLVFNYRGSSGYGKKFENSMSSNNMVEDTIEAIEYLKKERGIPEKHIFVLARSFGAGLALDAMGSLPYTIGGGVFQSPVLGTAVGKYPLPNIPLHFFFGAFDPITSQEKFKKLIGMRFGDDALGAAPYRITIFDQEGHNYHRTGAWVEFYSTLLNLISSSKDP